jgi:hypothetical protein
MVERVGINDRNGVGETIHQHARSGVRAWVIQGARGGQNFFAQFGRELIGSAEGVGNGGMGDSDETGDISQGTTGLHGWWESGRP